MSKYPSDHKISVKVEPMNGVHLAQCDFTCNLYVYENKVLSVTKEQCRKEDDDTYILTFNTKDIGLSDGISSLNLIMKAMKQVCIGMKKRHITSFLPLKIYKELL